MNEQLTERFPRQSQMALPLLADIAAQGGAAKPGEIYDRLADHFKLDQVTREATISANGRSFVAWDRHVRWCRQTLVAKELIQRETRGVWELTERANAVLKNAVRGTTLLAYSTPFGLMIWGSAEEFSAIVDRNSVQCLITSPMYPQVKAKEYGTKAVADWLEWMRRLAFDWRELLLEAGSMFINIGPVFDPGVPTESTYIEELTLTLKYDVGLNLIQKLYWHSPTKLPAPMQYVAIDRVRLKPSVETILWFSPTPHPYANNRECLTPYSKSMIASAAKPRIQKKRPSGHQFGETSFTLENGGAIAPTLITATNCSSNDAYHRAARAAGINAHPAIMPAAIPKLAIAMTTREDDLVCDPFAGSGVVARVAEDMKRRWICNERSRHYIEGSRLRFPHAA